MIKKSIIISLALCLLMIFVGQVIAKDNSLGSFHVALPEPLVEKGKNHDYIPIDEVADTIGFELEWRLKGQVVEGYLANIHFSSDNFIIANGHLYLPINIFVNLFGLQIEVKGNKYYIYRKKELFPEIKLDLNINKTSFDKKEPIAVSILVINKSNDSITMRHNTTKEYDLILKRFDREIWRLSENKHYGTVISINRLYPDEYLLYTELINPSEEVYMHYGTYKLYAEITTSNGGKIISDPVEFKIVN